MVSKEELLKKKNKLLKLKLLKLQKKKKNIKIKNKLTNTQKNENIVNKIYINNSKITKGLKQEDKLENKLKRLDKIDDRTLNKKEKEDINFKKLQNIENLRAISERNSSAMLITAAKQQQQVLDNRITELKKMENIVKTTPPLHQAELKKLEDEKQQLLTKIKILQTQYKGLKNDMLAQIDDDEAEKKRLQELLKKDEAEKEKLNILIREKEGYLLNGEEVYKNLLIEMRKLKETSDISEEDKIRQLEDMQREADDLNDKKNKLETDLLKIVDEKNTLEESQKEKEQQINDLKDAVKEEERIKLIVIEQNTGLNRLIKFKDILNDINLNKNFLKEANGLINLGLTQEQINSLVSNNYLVKGVKKTYNYVKGLKSNDKQELRSQIIDFLIANGVDPLQVNEQIQEEEEEEEEQTIIED